MKKNEFVKQLGEACEFEVESLSLSTAFESIDGYDSLSIMSIIAFVDENFNVSLKAAQLREATDFNSLINLIGIDKFEDD